MRSISMFTRALPVVVLLCAPVILAQVTAESDQPDRLRLSPHLFETRDGQQIEAQLGFLDVPEDRGDPEARRLQLAFVRLAATATEPGSPIVYLAGGPGSSGIDSAEGARLPLFLALRWAGDVILVDQRGTGRSRPSLFCRDSWSYPLDAPLDPAVVLETIVANARSCAESLRTDGVALSAYNAVEIADDLEDLRVALGAPQLRLLASSYGTHLALTAIRRHPASIESAVLMGVVGPDQTIRLPEITQRRLETIGTSDGRHGPALAEALGTVLERLEEPVDVAVQDLMSGREVDVRIGPFDLQMVTLRRLGTRRDIAKLEEAYARMLEGNFTPLARDFLALRKQWLGPVMPYAVVCASGTSPERWRTIESQQADVKLGRWLDYPYPEICSALGVEDLGPEHRAPVAAALPVLLISGTHDLRTPIENAEEVLAGFPAGRHLVIEGAGHGDDLMAASPEIARLVTEFLQGSPPAVDRIAAVPLSEGPPPAPPARVEKVTETLHGVEVVDPYRWLENDRTPETRLWAAAQNRHTDSLLHVLPGRFELRREIEGLLRADTAGRPWVRGERIFYPRRQAGQELATIVLREGESGAEQLLLEPAEGSASPRGYRILDISGDGGVLVFAEQEGGTDEYGVGLLDVATRRPLPDRLPRARYFNVSITPDGRSLYYSRETAPGQAARLFHHRLGTDPATDPVIFGEGYDSSTTLWGNLSDDGRYLVAHAASGVLSEVDVSVRNLATGGEMLEVARGMGALFYGGVLGGRLILHTNWQAPRGRILSADPDAPDRTGWRELVPQHDSAVIRTVFGSGERLFVEYLDDVQSRLAVFDLEGRQLGEVPFPEIGSLHGYQGRWDDPVVYLSFSSFHFPSSVFRYDVRSGTIEVWKRPEIPIDPSRFEIRQVWYSSQDGSRVPMFLIHAKTLELDGARPTLLRAYGGFGTSLTPSFNQEAAAWIQRGGVYAVANVRGGGELGDAWHQAAVREHKQVSIDDLHAAAQWLIANGYTRPSKLALSGHSHGGLLVAAAMVQKPELFRAVVSSHPLLDMLRYNKFLAARFWLAEFGSAEKPKYFHPLLAYSPYHRLDEGASYPAVMFITAADDTRVAPLHARKMTARMQALPGQEHPILMRHHAHAGHTGQGMPLSSRITELVDTLSFLLWQLDEL